MRSQGEADGSSRTINSPLISKATSKYMHDRFQAWRGGAGWEASSSRRVHISVRFNTPGRPGYPSSIMTQLSPVLDVEICLRASLQQMDLDMERIDDWLLASDRCTSGLEVSSREVA